ncbi:hypothetical protein TC41_1012 [Alicyclobacillus acidocaldarius subsp. acidocaldarius Tc-4-1]|uniref:Uncharacterized protein n=1 Tax=Alicyclobacillus acidocaldarius (strain Tc-4-1) TaxID=1048834 RepID=F8IFZ4_ALIAT|nr:hypothetical protein TC41_1012 [Alicyclobacillus acidocaldarius subsp. acidocaldarius Tc-4-1]
MGVAAARAERCARPWISHVLHMALLVGVLSLAGYGVGFVAGDRGINLLHVLHISR